MNLQRTYQRSPILSFCELTEIQQECVIDLLDPFEAEETNYVLWNDEPLPLSMFLRNNGGLFHGTYGLSYFSCYMVKLNKTNEWATVAYCIC